MSATNPSFSGKPTKRQERYHAFLSHHGDDKPLVKQLGEELVKRGLSCWLDEWNLVPGNPWLEASKQPLANATPAWSSLVRRGWVHGTTKKCAWRSCDASAHPSSSFAFCPSSFPVASAPKRASCPAFCRVQPGSSSGGHSMRRMPFTDWCVASKVFRPGVGREPLFPKESVHTSD
jgi:hypothetical protein